MQLSLAVYATAAEFSADGRIHMFGGGWDLLTIGQFPATVNSVVLVIRLVVSPAESGREHLLSGVLRRPDTAMITEIPNMEFTPESNPRHPDRPSFMWLILSLNDLKLECPGEYSTQIFVDGEPLGAADFDVVQEQANSTATSEI